MILLILQAFTLFEILEQDGEKEIQQDKVHQYENDGAENESDEAFCAVGHGHHIVPVVTDCYSEYRCDTHA